MDIECINRFWYFAQEFSACDAAYLTIGVDPHKLPSADKDSIEKWMAEQDYDVLIKLMISAIESDSLKARKLWYWSSEDGLDPSQTMIKREDITAWLKSNGIPSKFFFPDAPAPANAPATHEPDYLNPEHPRYAPKLAAAVLAWQAVTDPRPKTPKQAIIKWLRENAARFGLSDEEGKPNETAIEEIAKTANWKPEGGSGSALGG